MPHNLRLPSGLARAGWKVKITAWLPPSELLGVLAQLPGELTACFVAGSTDPVGKTLKLYRRDGRAIIVPFDQFPPTGLGLKPDFG